jgi:hypothetical protein
MYPNRATDGQIAAWYMSVRAPRHAVQHGLRKRNGPGVRREITQCSPPHFLIP